MIDIHSHLPHTFYMAMRLEQLRNADLNLLVYFVVLVEEKNVTRAAKRLRLTQSALSRVLQRLRSLFQDELLVRVNGTYQPTPRGQEVLKELGIVLPQIDKLISGEEFNPAHEEAKFRITAADSLSHLYGPLFSRRHAKTPNLVFGFSAYSDQRYVELEANSRDLVLDADFKVLPPNLHKEVLFRDTAVCAVAKNSPYKQKISLSDYVAARHIAVNILEERQPVPDAALTKLGLSRDCVLSVPYFGVALRMVAGSDLIATLPRCMSELLVNRKTIRLIRPPREVESFHYVMVWHKRQHADARSIWLRQTMREMTAELLTALRPMPRG
jgi:DNA-binding transcriptional LysR family regulator